MSDDERLYYRERAEAEIEAAQAAGHPAAARAHYVLAGYYLDLSYNPVGPSTSPRSMAGEAASSPEAPRPRRGWGPCPA